MLAMFKNDGDGGFDDSTVYGVLKPLLARAHDSLALPQIYQRLRLDRLRDRSGGTGDLARNAPALDAGGGWRRGHRRGPRPGRSP